MKKVTLPKSRRQPAKSKHGKARQQKIAGTIAKLSQIKPANAKAARVISLLTSWLADESGYDEEAWPELKRALNLERTRAGARRLFDA